MARIVRLKAELLRMRNLLSGQLIKCIYQGDTVFYNGIEFKKDVMFRYLDAYRTVIYNDTL